MPKTNILAWTSEIIRETDGRVRIVALEPVSHMSTGQAAKVIGCGRWTITRLYQLGLITGYKPGAARERSDGKGSNAVLRLDAESVLAYKQRQQESARKWQDG